MRGLVGMMDRTFCGDGRDGPESVRGRVGMGVKSAGMGGDGTKMPSSCTPLQQIRRTVETLTRVVILGHVFTSVQFMCCKQSFAFTYIQVTFYL